MPRYILFLFCAIFLSALCPGFGQSPIEVSDPELVIRDNALHITYTNQL